MIYSKTILDHIEQIVAACHPADREEAISLWHDIKPVRFGNRLTWAASPPNRVLASYQIAEDGAYLLIFNVQCYVFTDVVAAPGFRDFEPPPTGNAQWFVNRGAGPVAITGVLPIHLLSSASELLLIKGGTTASLEGILNAPPDVNVRLIRTIVYAYYISALIADRIGVAEVLVTGDNL